MLTSKDLLDKTGISRATLNNYIARGLLPKAVVAQPQVRGGNRPRQIGYFPDETLARIERIQRLKVEGLSMDEIAAKLAAPGIPESTERESAGPSRAQVISHPAVAAKNAPLVVTVDQMPHPAYMVNYKSEVVWFNDRARQVMGDAFSQIAPRTEERSVFRLLLLA